jgi:hypothetical protein
MADTETQRTEARRDLAVAFVVPIPVTLLAWWCSASSTGASAGGWLLVYFGIGAAILVALQWRRWWHG